mgnify:FL=1|jgi:hypothetical protein
MIAFYFNFNKNEIKNIYTEKTGKEIINLHLPLSKLNALVKIVSNWYEQDIDIGCYTQL